jgi:hypothetical protein
VFVLGFPDLLVMLGLALLVPIVMVAYSLPGMFVAFATWRAVGAHVVPLPLRTAFFFSVGGLLTLVPNQGHVPVPAVVHLWVGSGQHRLPWLIWMVIIGLVTSGLAAWSTLHRGPKTVE